MQSTRVAARKQKVLEDRGYRYDFRRQLFVNRTVKKAFSVPFIEDCDPEEFERSIAEDRPGADWQFFFSSGQQPSDSLRRELITVLG